MLKDREGGELALRSPAPRTEYKTPLIPKIHPNIHPESPPETQIRKKIRNPSRNPIRKKLQKIRNSYILRNLFVFGYSYILRDFFVFGFREGIRGVYYWGCILGIRGVLYSVRGAGDRKTCPESCPWTEIRNYKVPFPPDVLLGLRSARPASEAPNVGPRKQPKSSRKRCQVGPVQSAGKTAEKQPEGQPNSRKTAVLYASGGFPVSAVFRLFSRSDVRGLCSWSG